MSTTLANDEIAAQGHAYFCFVYYFRAVFWGRPLNFRPVFVAGCRSTPRSCDVRDMLLSASNCFQHVRRIDSRPCHSARVLRRWPSHPALVPQAPVSSNNAHHWSGAHARRGRQRRPPPGTDRVIPSEIILGPAQPTEPRSGGPFAAGKGHTCANPNLRYARLLPKHQLQSSVRAVVACRDCHAKTS